MVSSLVFSYFLFWMVQSRHAQHCPRGWILNDGNIMPPIGFGTFGRLDFHPHSSAVIPVLRQSLKLLELDYVDLCLIHHVKDWATMQVTDYLGLWRGMEEAKRLGLTRSIGVSNFNSTHINDIFVNSQTPPAVNQIEINPTFTNLELVAYCQSQGIHVMSYSPFGYLVPRPGVDATHSVPAFDHPILTKIAKKYHKRTSEVVIRYLVHGRHSKGWLLNDGNIMPPIALGTFGRQVDVEEIGIAVEWAIEAGYRHIDTSYVYLNEKIIGNSIKNVIKRGLVRREDLFITTKLDIYTNKDVVVPALRRSLERLQMDFIDLYLIHLVINPATKKAIDYINIWKGMEEAKKLGLTRSIGVSNFNSSHINNIFVNSKIRPAVNQIEINPTFTNLELVAYCQSQGIRVMSYSPFGYMVTRPGMKIPPPPSFDNAVLVKIAKKYRKTTSQVVIRYLIDRGTIPIPKSTNRNHIISNIKVFDFSLTEHEIYVINQFNLNKKIYNKNEPTEIYLQYYFGISKKEFLSKFFT